MPLLIRPFIRTTLSFMGQDFNLPSGPGQSSNHLAGTVCPTDEGSSRLQQDTDTNGVIVTENFEDL